MNDETNDFRQRLSGPGDRLRAAREAANLSAVDVARRLHLTSRVIEEIDSNDYSNIKFVFLRGYLRAYAKLVNVSGDEIVDAFNALEVQETPSDRPVWGLQEKGLTIKDKPVRWGTYFIVAGLIALVMLWWHAQHQLSPLHQRPLGSPTASKKVEKPANVTASTEPLNGDDILSTFSSEQETKRG